MAKKSTATVADGDIKARVLTDCLYGTANDVVTLSLDAADAGKAAGLIDTDPEAIAYAESLADA